MYCYNKGFNLFTPKLILSYVLQSDTANSTMDVNQEGFGKTKQRDDINCSLTFFQRAGTRAS